MAKKDLTEEDRKLISTIKRRAGITEQYSDDEWDDEYQRELGAADEEQEELDHKFAHTKEEMVQILSTLAKVYAQSNSREDVFGYLMGAGLTLGQAGVVAETMENLVDEIYRMM